MAKKAGAKNSGAWQRFNDFIRGAEPSQVAAITEAWYASAAIDAFFQAINTQFNQYGIPIPPELASLTSWTSYWAQTGVPYDVWMGKVSYDFYDPAGNGKYTPLLGPPAAESGIDVRYIARLAIFGDRQANWLAFNGGKHHVGPVVPPTKAALAKARTPEETEARMKEINRLREERRAAKVPNIRVPPKKAGKKALTK